MKKLVFALAMLVCSSASAQQQLTGIWPGIGQNQLLDQLRCYALQFAAAEDQYATFICQNGNCTARVSFTWLGGYSELRASAPAGFTETNIVTSDGTKLAHVYMYQDVVFYVAGRGQLDRCEYLKKAPFGRYARFSDF